MTRKGLTGKTVNTILRMTPEVHEKLRWISFRDRRSQNAIIQEILEKALANEEIPQEARP